jgi:glycosyltransferase involved in cell wall biosynthesis
VTKIAYVATALDIGGAEIALHRLLGHFPPGHEHHVFSLSGIGEVGARIAGLGVPVEALNIRPALPDPRALGELVQRLRRLKPDVVQTWMYHADLIGGLAARAAGVPAIVWGIRNGAPDAPGTKWTTRAVARACATLSRRIPTRIVFNSERAVGVHVRMGYDGAKAAVIPNGIELRHFRPDPQARADVRAELGIAREAPLIGLFARFHANKNLGGFFKAAGLLSARRPDVRYLLAGPGVDDANASIRRWRNDAGVGAVSHLLGMRTDVPRLMAALDIATSSSSSEGFPNVLAEAMACGIPCIATDAGDSSLILGDAGTVVPVGGMAELASAWHAFLALAPKERAAMGGRARARVTDLFEIGSVSRRYASLYDGLARRPIAGTSA